MAVILPGIQAIDLIFFSTKNKETVHINRTEDQEELKILRDAGIFPVSQSIDLIFIYSGLKGSL